MIMFRKITGYTTGFGVGFTGVRELLTVEWVSDCDVDPSLHISFSWDAPLHIGVMGFGRVLYIQLFGMVDIDNG